MYLGKAVPQTSTTIISYKLPKRKVCIAMYSVKKIYIGKTAIRIAFKVQRKRISLIWDSLKRAMKTTLILLAMKTLRSLRTKKKWPIFL
jgi:hypothetical protein